MNKNWSRILPPMVVLFATLTLSHLAFANSEGYHPIRPYPGPAPAPEIDPRLAIEGLALAGGAAALVWERIRRRR